MKQSKKPKPTKAELAELQAAKDLLVSKGVMNLSISHKIQNILDNMQSGSGRKWGGLVKDAR